MPASVVQNSAYPNAGAASQKAITLPGGIVAGNLLLLFIVHDRDDREAVVIDGGWTQLLNLPDATGTDAYEILGKVADGADAGKTITIEAQNPSNQSASTVTMNALFLEFSGADGAAVIASPNAQGEMTADSVTHTYAADKITGLNADSIVAFMFALRGSSRSISSQDADLTLIGSANGGTGIFINLYGLYEAAPGTGNSEYVNTISAASRFANLSLEIPPGGDTTPPGATVADSTATVTKVTESVNFNSPEAATGYVAVYTAGATAPADGPAVASAAVGVDDCLGIGSGSLTAGNNIVVTTGEFAAQSVDVYAVAKDASDNYDSVTAQTGKDRTSSGLIGSGSGITTEQKRRIFFTGDWQ